MEDIGTEVSLKIRSAIKAKLMELGAFVDEELPDYIMVMVANKRSKQQMDVDLQLFLGPNTTNFTGWLHTVLQKLEEVTIAKNLTLNQKKTYIKNPDAVEVPSKSRLPSTNSTEAEVHKHKHEKKKKPSETSGKKGAKESKSAIKSSSGKRPHTTVPDFKLEESDISRSVASSSSNSRARPNHVTSFNCEGLSVDARALGDTNDLESPQSAKPVSSGKRTSPQSSSVQRSEDDDEDFINIKEDADAMDLLDAELLEDNQKNPRVNKGKSVSVTQVTSAPEEEVDDLEVQRANLLRDLKLLDKPDKSSVEKRPSLFERLGSKMPATSVLDRLGIRVDPRPRLNIIDPNELDIVAPTQREVDLTKQKVGDRRGKRPGEGDGDLQDTVPRAAAVGGSRTKEEVPSSRSRREKERDDRDGRGRNEESETVRLGVRDRLGGRASSSSSSKRTVTVSHSERKHVDGTDSPRSHVMDRLGKKVNREDASSERTGSPREPDQKPRVADRLGKKVTPDRSPPRNAEVAKASVMERLGRRRVGPPNEQASPGSKTRRERDDHTKRSSRVVGKEAAAGELQYSLTAKRSAEEHSDDEAPRKRSLLSRVVAVKRDTPPSEEDEPYDPTNPAVASVIRVKPRPKVPASMQATKNLLLKAMAEAHKSVVKAPVRKEPQSQRSDGLFTRKYRGAGQPLEKINVTVENPLDDREVGYEEEEEMYEDEEVAEEAERKGVEVPPRRALQKITRDEPRRAASLAGKGTVALDESESPKPDDEDDIVFEEIFDDEMNEEDLNEMNVSNGGSNLGNVSSLNIVLHEAAGDGSAYVPTKIETKMSRRPTRASSPQFVVTLDGVDPNIFNPRKRTMDVTESRQLESGVVSPVPGLNPDTDDRVKKEEERNERNTSPVVYKKPKISTVGGVTEAMASAPVKPLDRCKYWPTCGKGDLCEFLHPTTPCKMFPGCKFGDRCLYIHPGCKFDVSCTRRECPYSHTSARGGALQAQVLPSGKSRVQTQPLCKFYPKCSNVNCSFLHPKPCRFGRACTNRDCSFFHEEIPTAEKLKWVNTNRF